MPTASWHVSVIVWPVGLESDCFPVLGTGEVTRQVLCPDLGPPPVIEMLERIQGTVQLVKGLQNKS